MTSIKEIQECQDRFDEQCVEFIKADFYTKGGTQQLQLSIAQQCLESRGPYEAAVMHAAYKGMPSPMVKVFHFEDGSYLSFNITYTVADAGRSLPWQPQNTI